MKNIVRAQIYQLKKERLLPIVFVLCIGLLCITIINQRDFDTFGEILCEISSIVPQMSLLFLFTAVAVICGRDFADKTGNYEIMGGHTRKEMYMGRASLAIGVAVVGSVLICYAIIGLGSAFMGWGDAVSLKDVLLRVTLMSFPMFRIACEAVFLTFIIRNAYIVMAAGYVYIFFITELLLGMSTQPASYYLGISNLAKLMDMTAFQTYSPVNPGVKMTVYDASISLSDAGGTVIVSVVVGVVFLVLGYHFFKTDDME